MNARVAAALNLSVDKVTEDEKSDDKQVIIMPVKSITIIFYNFYY